MNRRVLLIDADPRFRDTLTQQLHRYRVDVTAEPDPDRAFALGNADAPALIVIAVEEPEKAGFRVFQKSKKGALSKIPIVLVTASVSPESFAKHRGLKVHADEYIDKRSMTEDELIGKLDNLIGLGDLQEDELAIPIEDDIPMEIAEGDVVLDETVGDDSQAEFAHEARTVGPGDGIKVDSMVEAETDAAFAALLGDDEPARRPVAAQPAPEPATIGSPAETAVPEPVPHPHESGEALAAPHDEAVPALIHDGGLQSHEDFDSRSQVGIEPAAEFQERHVAPSHVLQVPAGPESQPAIMIDDDELLSVDDELPVEVEVEAEPQIPRQSDPVITSASRPVEVPSVARTATGDTARPPDNKSGSHPAIDLGLDRVAHDAESEQSGVYDRRSLRKIGELERSVSQLKTELERARAAANTAAKGGGREREFLNLRESIVTKDQELRTAKDEMATRDKELADAREKLRQAQHAKVALETKNAELETRLVDGSGRSTQLEASARAAAAQAAYLQQELEVKTRDAGSAESTRMRLEQELATERALRASSASETERTLRVEREQLVERHQAELAAVRAEWDSAADATARAYETLEVAAATAQRQLEAARADAVAAAAAAQRELEAARADAAAAEHGKLETAHAEAQAAIDGARAEAQAAIDGARADAKREVDKARSDAQRQVETVRSETAQQLEAAHSNLEYQLSAVRTDAQSTLDVALGTLREELEAAHRTAVEQATEQAVDEVRRAIAVEHENALGALERVHAGEVVRLRADHTGELNRIRVELSGELERVKALLREAEAHAAAELETASEQHATALEALSEQHARDLAAKDRDHADARDRDAEAHGAALAKLRDELERVAAGHEVKLGTVRRELDEAIAQHERATGELHEHHKSELADAAFRHEQQLAKLQEDRAQLAEGARLAAEAHHAALADLQAKHETELASVRETADREAAEHKAALFAARRAADDAAKAHQAEREAAEQRSATAISELEVKREYLLAAANAEHLQAKTAAEAEHDRALAAAHAAAEAARKELEADHAKVARELTTERDELRRGLSAARDSLKRSESELASAVQTIADRNADLRVHATAIAERDQRIAELRKEIESLEQENANYQEQVLRAYQKIKTDEAMVARARKAMAIALTVLDDDGKPTA